MGTKSWDTKSVCADNKNIIVCTNTILKEAYIWKLPFLIRRYIELIITSYFTLCLYYSFLSTHRLLPIFLFPWTRCFPFCKFSPSTVYLSPVSRFEWICLFRSEPFCTQTYLSIRHMFVLEVITLWVIWNCSQPLANISQTRQGERLCVHLHLPDTLYTLSYTN